MGIKDSLLRKYVKVKIKRINKNVDFERLFEDVPHGPHSTIAFLISDVGDDVGFGYDKDEGKIVEFSEISNPTLIIKCSKRTFKAMMAGKLTPDEMYYGNLAEFEGDGSSMFHKISLEKFFYMLREEQVI